MNIVYETNGKGFLGWIVELPGAYVRGKSIEDARNKIPSELDSFEDWFDLAIQDRSITTELIFQSNIMIENADSDILLEYDRNDYTTKQAFEYDCDLVLLSAKKIYTIYSSCNNKSRIDQTKVRKTFYGNVHSTIQAQFEHIVNVQQYLRRLLWHDRIHGKAISRMNTRLNK